MAQEWWVPLSAAGVGALTAALISWLTRKSERKRDDTRWEREAEDRKAERDHDARMQWREQRVTAYSQLIAALDTFMSAARMLTFKVNWKLDDADLADRKFFTRASTFDDVALLLEGVMAAGVPVAIAATKPVRDAAQAVVDEGNMVMALLATEGSAHRVDVSLPELKQAREVLLDAIRKELHVDLSVTSPPIATTQEPSSGQTS